MRRTRAQVRADIEALEPWMHMFHNLLGREVSRNLTRYHEVRAERAGLDDELDQVGRGESLARRLAWLRMRTAGG